MRHGLCLTCLFLQVKLQSSGNNKGQRRGPVTLSPISTKLTSLSPNSHIKVVCRSALAFVSMRISVIFFFSLQKKVPRGNEAASVSRLCMYVIMGLQSVLSLVRILPRQRAAFATCGVGGICQARGMSSRNLYIVYNVCRWHGAGTRGGGGNLSCSLGILRSMYTYTET